MTGFMSLTATLMNLTGKKNEYRISMQANVLANCAVSRTGRETPNTIRGQQVNI